MKFFSPLVLLAILFTFTLAAPTERALSKRSLDFSIFANIVISIRSAEVIEDEHRLDKRLYLDASFTLDTISDIGVVIRRDAGESDEELSKRTEEYNVVVASLPSSRDLSGRSEDPYAGRSVLVSMSDAFLQALQQQRGVSRDQAPQFIAQNMRAEDTDTGTEYSLVPNSDSTASKDIVVHLDYLPQSE